MQLTAHFSREELACRDGCGIEQRPEYQSALLLTAQMLEHVRHACGDHPVTVDCGIRCPTHNKAIGGEPNSFHLRGQAADFKIPGLTPQHVQATVATLPDVGGIGHYETFTHVDTRGYRATWNG